MTILDGSKTISAASALKLVECELTHLFSYLIHQMKSVSTGATSGIGKESARVLAMKGAHVIMAIRNLKTGEEVKSEITRDVPKARVELMKLDLSSLASVRQFSDEFNNRKLPLNVLMYGIPCHLVCVMLIYWQKNAHGHVKSNWCVVNIIQW